jgi:hypothetical protein
MKLKGLWVIGVSIGVSIIISVAIICVTYFIGIAMKDRYFYGVNADGRIMSVGDKLTGKVYYPNASIWEYSNRN